MQEAVVLLAAGPSKETPEQKEPGPINLRIAEPELKFGRAGNFNSGGRAGCTPTLARIKIKAGRQF